MDIKDFKITSNDFVNYAESNKDKWIHQDQALEAMLNNQVGRIYLPTGSGKSRIEFRYAKEKLIANDGVHQIVIIVAPTIILCQQLIQDFYKFFKENEGFNTESLLFVSSAEIPEIIYEGRKIPSHKIGQAVGTKKSKISHAIQNHKKEDRDTVIISTYASFDRAIEAIKDASVGGEEVFLLADEAHRFSSSGTPVEALRTLRDNLELFKERFFLTATPKYHDGSISSMDNEDIYGSVIYEEKPFALIKRGVICAPRLWIAKMPSTISEDNFEKHVVDFILKSYLKHEAQMNIENGANAKGRIGGKVVVTVKGSEQLKNILDGGMIAQVDKINKMKKGAKIKIAYTMSHEDIGMYFDDKRYSTNDKDGWLSAVRNACYYSDQTIKNDARLIIFHYDQLTEGIDIPSMTGCIFLRHMSNCKVIQNIGRTLRTNPLDHNKDPSDKSKWVKPYSDVFVPSLFKNDLQYMINEFREEYNIDHFYSISEEAFGINYEQIDLQNDFNKKKRYFREIDELYYIREKLEQNRLLFLENMKAGKTIDILNFCKE